MKLKNFDDYLKKRLDPQEIAEIESQAEMELESLKSLQNAVSQVVSEYMVERDVGFNELVRRLDVSPTQVAKIQKGEANLTLSSLAHLAALINKKPYIVFVDI
jgi:transcriptional regulator with XRE-family HTH domain